MKGLVFSIKRYSVHDGPGIRVTVFLKGCPLRCRWCHNPEGISPVIETVTSTFRVGGHEFWKSEEVGRYYSVGEILEILDRERIFMNNSKGGVTFSGGEPMMQFDFLLEIVRACKNNGYHTTIDTSGFSTTGNYNSLLPYTDLFLFDLKHLDPADHLRATGVSNEIILSSYRYLIENAGEVALRIPVIPGFNDDPAYMERLREFIISSKTDRLIRINLLPYHKTGSSKYKKFDLPYLMEGVETPSKVRMQELKCFFRSAGVKVKIGG
jgi:pyruvate formate lyase activating enzyme